MTSVIKVKYKSGIYRSDFWNNLLLVLLISACGNTSQNSSITIGALNGPTGLSLVKMMDQNMSVAADQKATYIIKNDPELIKAMMAREEVDLALIPFTMAVLLYNNDFPYQLVGVPVWGSLFLVGSDSLIRNMEDLKEKTVHELPRNMTPDIIFRHLLIAHDLDPDRDLTLNYTFPTPFELSGALAAKRVELGIIPEPMVSQVLDQNQELFVILDISHLWQQIHGEEIPLAQTALVVRKAWARENRALLATWCAQYAEAIKWTNQNTIEAGQLAISYQIGRNAHVVASAIPRCQLNFKYGLEEKQKLMNYLELLNNTNSKIIGGRLPDEDFFYSK
jgi:NitT/TauT family transport system substrate-binding protein